MKTKKKIHSQSLARPNLSKAESLYMQGLLSFWLRGTATNSPAPDSASLQEAFDIAESVPLTSESEETLSNILAVYQHQLDIAKLEAEVLHEQAQEPEVLEEDLVQGRELITQVNYEENWEHLKNNKAGVKCRKWPLKRGLTDREKVLTYKYLLIVLVSVGVGTLAAVALWWISLKI